MTNMRLINDAVKLVVDLFEAEGITESTITIRTRVIEWYNKTEIIDAEMLAAAAITGSYQFGTSWNDLLSWKEFYFPSNPIEEINQWEALNSTLENEIMVEWENFHIGEIEAAQEDIKWR